MPIMLTLLKSALLFFAVVQLQGCQLEHAVDRTAFYSGKTGLSKGYELSRWHNVAISPSSTISIATEMRDGLNAQALSTGISKQFLTHFGTVIDGGHSNSTAEGVSLAKQHGSNYLLYVQVVEYSSLLNPDDPKASTYYDHLLLTLSVIDPIRAKTVDKFTLSADSAFYNVIGNNMQALISTPIDEIAMQLSGR